MPPSRIVIAGGGHAGYQTAASLRQEGYTGAITLVADEPGLPYQRPPLSKAYLLGKMPRDGLRFRAPEFYAEQRIDCVRARIEVLDRAGRCLVLVDGTRLPYDELVLALGARNRVPQVPGIGLDGVQGLRTLADADMLQSRLHAARRVVVVGAGFIGLEVAAAAASRGAGVDVLELGTRPMARALTPSMAALFDAAHAGWGVHLHYGQQLARVIGDGGKVTAVQTASGETLPADLVVYGIGVVPNEEQARAADLRCTDGVCVDEQLRTDDDAVSAIGDLVRFPSPWAIAPVRLESVQNAVEQARAVAARLAGKPAPPYAALPWFWSDQGDMKLQIAGLSQDHDSVIELAPEPKSLTVLCFRAGRLVAVETCNRPADHLASRKLIARPNTLSPAEAAAPGFDLKAYEAATRTAA